MDGDVIVSKGEYNYLVKRSTMLGYLESAGVVDTEPALEALDERICGETFAEYCRRFDDEMTDE
jgi:hypothetical protein